MTNVFEESVIKAAEEAIEAWRSKEASELLDLPIAAC